MFVLGLSLVTVNIENIAEDNMLRTSVIKVNVMFPIVSLDIQGVANFTEIMGNASLIHVCFYMWSYMWRRKTILK